MLSLGLPHDQRRHARDVLGGGSCEDLADVQRVLDLDGHGGGGLVHSIVIDHPNTGRAAPGHPAGLAVSVSRVNRRPGVSSAARGDDGR
jgi:hypothetical protein